jgi:hypothetical protein
MRTLNRPERPPSARAGTAPRGGRVQAAPEGAPIGVTAKRRAWTRPSTALSSAAEGGRHEAR